MSKRFESDEDSAAVQAHPEILQSVIHRMSSTSSSSKAWCIALVSAVLVIVADKGKPEFAWFAVIPTLLFLLLDAYYLSLLKGFRNSYNRFIDKLQDRQIQPGNLYAVVPSGPTPKRFLQAFGSFSVWPIYSALLAMIYAAKDFVI